MLGLEHETVPSLKRPQAVRRWMVKVSAMPREDAVVSWPTQSVDEMEEMAFRKVEFDSLDGTESFEASVWGGD